MHYWKGSFFLPQYYFPSSVSWSDFTFVVGNHYYYYYALWWFFIAATLCWGGSTIPITYKSATAARCQKRMKKGEKLLLLFQCPACRNEVVGKRRRTLFRMRVGIFRGTNKGRRPERNDSCFWSTASILLPTLHNFWNQGCQDAMCEKHDPRKERSHITV